MMDISIYTEVRCLDGVVGKSTYIVVDLVTEQVTHIVLKAKEDGQEYLVPFEKIRTADREAILLDCDKDEISELTSFHETYFNGYDTYSGSPPIPSAGMGANYTLYHPYRTLGTGVDDAPMHPSTVQLAVNKGAAVLATDGRVGKVDELVINPKTHQVTHLVLRQHHLMKQLAITIPITEIERAEVNTIILKISKKEVAALPTVNLRKYPWE
jgi:sporulation protein YlmC with PRC-barrel domain